MSIRHFKNFYPQINPTAYVDPEAIVIGRVFLAENVSIWPTAVLRGDINEIIIGARSNIQDGSILHVVHDYEYCPGGLKVIIGENVTIGHGVILHGCTIGSHCLIGMNATVLDGAIIEENVIVGANSLVHPNKKLEKGFLYFGNPVRQVRALTPSEMALVEYSANIYVEIKNQYSE